MNHRAFGMASLAVLVGMATLGACCKSTRQTDEKSLYERLGGEPAISAVVEGLLKRLAANETLNANPAIEHARLALPPGKLQKLLTEFMCKATGGPQVYTGRTMQESHAHLNINGEEWESMAADFAGNLDQFNVPEQEKKELLDLVESLRSDIVTR